MVLALVIKPQQLVLATVFEKPFPLLLQGTKKRRKNK
jgi:hypothetical protein